MSVRLGKRTRCCFDWMILVICDLYCHNFLLALCDSTQRLVVACALLGGKNVNPIPAVPPARWVTLHPLSRSWYCDEYLITIVIKMKLLVYIWFNLLSCESGYVMKLFVCVAALETLICSLRAYCCQDYETQYQTCQFSFVSNLPPTKSMKTNYYKKGRIFVYIIHPSFTLSHQMCYCEHSR